MDYVQQMAALNPSSQPPVQMDGPGGQDAAGVHAAAAHGLKGSGGSLPHLGSIHQSFGRHDVGSVSAHVGGQAGEACQMMGAQAYASQNSTAFKSTPDLHTAAHEAAHIVQQRGGVQLKGGVGSVGDTYEKHADAVADAVVQGKSAEGLLDQHAGSGGGGVQRSEAPVQQLTQAPSRGGYDKDSDERLSEIFEDAGMIAPTFYELTHKFAQATKGTALCPMTIKPNSPQDDPQGMPKLKGMDRAQEKYNDKYKKMGVGYGGLTDIVRATVVFPTVHQLMYASHGLLGGLSFSVGNESMRYLGAAEGLYKYVADKQKNRLYLTTHDFLFNVTIHLPVPNSSTVIDHVCELQLHIQDVLDYKNTVGHDLYNVTRDKTGKYGKDEKIAAQEKMDQGVASAWMKALKAEDPHRMMVRMRKQHQDDQEQAAYHKKWDDQGASNI